MKTTDGNLDICLRERSGVFDRSREGFRFRDDIRAVGKLAEGLTKNLHLGHNKLKCGGHHGLLVYWVNLCIRTKSLPHVR